MDQFSFFTTNGGSLADEVLTPTDMARSLWSSEQMHGVASSGALGRGLEQAARAAGRSDLQPARYTVDLFQPATMGPTTIVTRVVREGRRIMLIDADLVQDGVTRARGSATFLLPTEAPDGAAWQPSVRPVPPPLEIAPTSEDPHLPFVGSFDNDSYTDVHWSQKFREHQNPLRKQNWSVAVPVIPGEKPSPFTATASLADSTNMIVNWGTKGVQFINTDVTVALARLPISTEIGVSALDRIEHDGIAVGATTMYDRKGAFATAVITSLSNAQRTVDFEVHDFE